MGAAVCPKCGGSDLRQITPGFFKCDSETQVGWHHAPPAVTGAGFQRLPVFGPCEHEFQAGVSAATRPCGWPDCGRDSIGACVGSCGRRLCGLHGRSSGPFICAECESKRQREAEAAQDEAEEAADRAKAAVEMRMVVATGVSDLLEILREADVEVGQPACRDAWVRLVSIGTISARHDLVETTGREFAHGWVPTFHRGADWGVWSSPTPIGEIWSSSDEEVWLDAAGEAYKRNGGVRLMISGGSSRTRQFVLPKGETANRRRRTYDGLSGVRYWEVANGIAIARSSDEYPRTLERVLENYVPG